MRNIKFINNTEPSVTEKKSIYLIENCRDCRHATYKFMEDGTTEYSCPYRKKVVFKEFFGDKAPYCKSLHGFWNRLKSILKKL